MYIHIFEAVVSSLAALSAGFSYALYRASKKYNKLSVQAAKLSVFYAEIASARSISAAKSKDAASSFADMAGGEARVAVLNASTAQGYSKTAAEHSANAQSFELAAKEHVIEAAEQVDVAAGHVQTAQMHADVASQHVDRAAEQVEMAAGHVATAGTLSVAVSQAAQKAASKSQLQAECYACERAVNSYTLRPSGQIVCGYCAARGK